MDGNLARETVFAPDLLEWRQKIGGKIVMMAPGLEDHSTVSGNIFGLFHEYLRGKPCRVYMEGPYVYLSEDDYYIPDVCVLCDRDKIRNNRIYGAPDLVVEVLSKSTTRYDRGRKKDIYEQSGVREYWLVNPRERIVEQYVREDGKLRLREVCAVFRNDELAFPEDREQQKTAFPCGIFPDLEISIDEVFYDMIE